MLPLLLLLPLADAPQHSAELAFPLHKKHNHAPGLVELPSGELLLSWYRGSGEASADDVAVLGSRKKTGKEWGEPFEMADNPGFPDGNTVLFVDPKGKLWLFWPLILANSWDSCLTQYRTSTDFEKAGTPKWDWQASIPLKPKEFEKTMRAEFPNWDKLRGGTPKGTEEAMLKKVGDKLAVRLGWQPRCKPTVLKSGRILLPLYTDTFSVSVMAMTDDGGKTWTASAPLAGFGNIQPAVLEKKDGTLVAYMREAGLLGKIRVSESKDGGETWGTVGVTDLPNPGAGLDAVKLASGNWLLVYNDTKIGRNSLAVSISDDEGKTWKWTRHLEKEEKGQYHYPVVIQGKDGTIHAAYSYFVADGKSMKHAAFNEAWVKAGDGK